MEQKQVKMQKVKTGGAGPRLFWWMLARPYFLLIYGIFWYTLYRMCMYGGIRKRGAALLACSLFFLAYLILFGIRLWRIKRKCSGGVPEAFSLEEFEPERVWFYYFTKKYLHLFWKDKRYEKRKLDKEEMSYAKLKLSTVPFYRKFTFGIPAICGVIIITALGCSGIAKSGRNLSGKLGWKLYEYENSETVVFSKDNIYAYGIDGMLEDIQTKIDLPETLMVKSSFNLHFLPPDGTIASVDTMLYGYDEDGNYVDSYLISYDRDKSDKIKIYLHGGNSDTPYDEEKALSPLVSALSVIPLKTNTAGWDEEEYGILYYGVRTWSSLDGNILLINGRGEIAAWDFSNSYEATGYSVSLFCPNNEEIAPYRYLYAEDFVFEETGLGEEITGEDDTLEKEDDTDWYIYYVRKGDCLWRIAEELLDDGSRWEEIYEANRDIIGDDPALIYEGTPLKIYESYFQDNP